MLISVSYKIMAQLASWRHGFVVNPSRTPDRRRHPLGPAAPDLVTLRDAWRLRSLADGWHSADDWHNREVDAVAEAMRPGVPSADLARGCGALGRARARAGVGITETITDLAALYAVLDRGNPPLQLVSCIAEGWAEEGLARHTRGRCEDPLTGLTTLPYLRTRLAEVYREADQLGTYRLVAVSPTRRPDPWRRLAADILLGHDLRTAFPGGDTLAQSPVSGAGIALIHAQADLAARYTKLRRTVELGYGARIQLSSLPALLTDALHLVDELAH
jgi:hypothetical protein